MTYATVSACRDERRDRQSPGNFSDITSANETNCSPTSIGATVGPRQALCYKVSISIANTVTYNCDTTLP